MLLEHLLLLCYHEPVISVTVAMKPSIGCHDVLVDWGILGEIVIPVGATMGQ